MADEGDDNGNSILLKEWEQARDVLKTFDDRIHDLRKYGFTFVTGLFTIEGILLPFVSSAPSSTITPIAKFGVLAATTLLIIVLRWFDGNYQGFLYGASLRAIVIERFLNLEITDEISVRYEIEKLWIPKIVLYAGFEGAVFILAWALLPDFLSLSSGYIYFFVGAAAESILYYAFFSPQRLRNKLDWSLDRLVCRGGDRIRVMVTNLNSKKKWTGRGSKQNQAITWNRNQTAWRILNQMNRPVYSENVTQGPNPLYRRGIVEVKPGSSYTWSFEVNLEPGIYQISVNVARSNFRRLARELHVLPDLPNPPEVLREYNENIGVG